MVFTPLCVDVFVFFVLMPSLYGLRHFFSQKNVQNNSLSIGLSATGNLAELRYFVNWHCGIKKVDRHHFLVIALWFSGNQLVRRFQNVPTLTVHPFTIENRGARN